MSIVRRHATRTDLSPVWRAGHLAVMRIGAIFWAVILLTLPALAQAGTRPVFAAGSFWYKPVPRDVALNSNSANYVSEFLRQIQVYYGTVGINTAAYSSPVYVAGSDVPAQPVAQWDCHKSGYVDRDLTRQWAAVPIPSYSQPADGTDSEMTVYQPSTDRMWEFWRARQVGGQWEACWGGGMQTRSDHG
jgi:hypothetical protein